MFGGFLKKKSGNTVSTDEALKNMFFYRKFTMKKIAQLF